MAGVLLPQELVAELGDIARRAPGHRPPDAGERQQPVADVGRQGRRTATFGRPDLVAGGGVAGHVVRGERCVGPGLAAGEPAGADDGSVDEVAEMGRDEVDGGVTAGIWSGHHAMARMGAIAA